MLATTCVVVHTTKHDTQTYRYGIVEFNVPLDTL